MGYSETEKEVESVTIHGNECRGCAKHKKDIMISYTQKGSREIIDLFFTTKQAEKILKKLNARLKENE